MFFNNDRNDLTLNAIVETTTAARLLMTVHNVNPIGGRQTASPYAEIKTSAAANLPKEVLAPVSFAQTNRITPFMIRFTNSRISI